MPTDENPDKDDPPRDDDAGTASDGDEAEAQDASGAAGEASEEPVEDVPRNRAERRAAERRAKRAPAPNRSNPDVVADRIGRPRVPPRTMSGKSSADEVPPWARNFVDWLSRRGKVLAAGAAAVIAIAGGAVLWTLRREGARAEAADLYFAALETASATIRAADAPPDPAGTPPRPGPTYTDATARSRAALEAFRRASSRDPNAAVLPLARLSEATTLYDLGRHAEAKRIFEGLAGADLAGLEARALEGFGFTLEALNEPDAALRKYEELGRIQDSAWRDLAAYHQARIHFRQNRRDRAKDLLRGVLERARRAGTDEAVGQGSTVTEQAQALLRDIDPNDPLARQPDEDRDPNAAIRRMLEQRLRARPGGAPQGE